MPDEEAARTNGGERGIDGRFQAGNRAAAGRRAHSTALREALHEAISPDDMRAIAHALLRGAKRGNVKCAGLLLQHLIGKPAQALLIGGGDDDDSGDEGPVPWDYC